MPLTDLQLGPFKIPKGVSVGFYIYGMHRNPKHFADPHKFNPERFMPGNPELKSRPPNAFMPFGLGARNCIGQKYAVLSAMLFFVLTLPKLRVYLDDSRWDEEVKFNDGVVSVAPSQGVWLKVSER